MFILQFIATLLVLLLVLIAIGIYLISDSIDMGRYIVSHQGLRATYLLEALVETLMSSF